MCRTTVDNPLSLRASQRIKTTMRFGVTAAALLIMMAAVVGAAPTACLPCNCNASSPSE
jgi:hypothetical protein